MGKDLSISILMDFYGELLTSKQQEALDFYYNQDLSLFEIAQGMNISRQGVRDFIKRGEKQLVEMEEKLGLAGRFHDLNVQIGYIDDIVLNIEKLNPSEQVVREVEKLKEISHKIKLNL